MKKRVLCLAISFFLFNLSLSFADASNPRGTIENFLSALKRGDIEELQNLTAGSYYSSNKNKIESNPAYSEFLKNFYENSEFRITGTLWDHDSIIYCVEVRTNGSVSAYTKFRLQKSGGPWKVTEELPVS